MRGTARVVVVVVSGMRDDALDSVPALRSLLGSPEFERDATRLRLRAPPPSNSVPAWLAVLTGATSELTGVWADRRLPETPFDSVVRQARLHGLSSFATGSPWFTELYHSELMHEGRFFAEGAVPPPYGAVEQHQLFQPSQPQPPLAAAVRGPAAHRPPSAARVQPECSPMRSARCAQPDAPARLHSLLSRCPTRTLSRALTLSRSPGPAPTLSLASLEVPRVHLSKGIQCGERRHAQLGAGALQPYMRQRLQLGNPICGRGCSAATLHAAEVAARQPHMWQRLQRCNPIYGSVQAQCGAWGCRAAASAA